MNIFSFRAADGTAKPINWKRNLFLVWFGQIIALCGDSFALPFIPLYLRDRFGLTGEAERGACVAAYQFFGLMTFCISNPIWGMLADRYGRKLMLLRAYFLNGITIPLLMVAPSPAWLIAIKAIVSCFSGTVSASQALIVSNTPEEHHGFALGVLSTAVWSGTLLGLLGGGLIVSRFGYTAAFITCGAIFIFSGLLTLFFVRENFVPRSKTRTAAAQKLDPQLRFHIVTLLVFLLMYATARRMDIHFVPMLVEVVGGTDRAVLYTSYISALAAAGGILSGLMFGALSDRFPTWLITLPAMLAAGATTILQGRSDSLWMLATCRFLNYFAAGGIEPVFLSALSKIVPAANRGTALGWSASVRVAGGMTAAALSGAVISHWQTRGVFFTAGTMMLMLTPAALLILHRIRCGENSAKQVSHGNNRF